MKTLLNPFSVAIVYLLVLLGSFSASYRSRDVVFRNSVPVCGIDGLPIPITNRVIHPRLVYPDNVSGSPKIIANDNRLPAGHVVNDTLSIELDVHWGDLFMESPTKPGLRMVAFAENGKAPSVPAPLIRTKTGTVLRVTVHNTLSDSTLTVYGLYAHPATMEDSLFLRPGETKTVCFPAGEPGTYLYRGKLGNDMQMGEEQQLGGAFIVDPVEGSPADRVFVLNIFSTAVDTSIYKNGGFESLTLNGKSWPYTEAFTASVGDTLRWRIVNASARPHPMHLHGFYYAVLSRGTMLADQWFNKEDRPMVVTETSMPFSTYVMEWKASRPGNWIYHCHLSFHTSPDIRLPITSDPKSGHSSHDHMAGLVIGIYVKPGPTDLITRGPDRHINLIANEYDSANTPKSRFILETDKRVAPATSSLLILKQYQNTYVTVKNRTHEPTSVHWHGLEIASWSDGVPGYSASNGRMSPVIKPDKQFTYKLSLLRAGTFIYHAHLNDPEQLSRGLYGPMIVLKANETFDPTSDHIYTLGFRKPEPLQQKEVEINGLTELPTQTIRLNQPQRLRLINISIFAMATLSVTKDDNKLPITIIAKDGLDLPLNQQKQLLISNQLGAGETSDFMFTPTTPGTYTLTIATGRYKWPQTLIVRR